VNLTYVLSYLFFHNYNRLFIKIYKVLIFRKISGYTTHYKPQTLDVQGVNFGWDSESNRSAIISLTQIHVLPATYCFNQVLWDFPQSLQRELWDSDFIQTMTTKSKSLSNDPFHGTRHIQLKHLCHIYIYICALVSDLILSNVFYNVTLTFSNRLA
jgi:hypothetical protein